ncbi:hypothetical protein KIPE111705_24685 [Kibdelosporangium persicum]|uniref:Uncharacterized protein n=1 Tax=Kibdelosporangium persicum TaxID=2698649 RepID=A0ABX2FEM5_9PSEU|nr:hypothetical protein [Kibdelosporangium persicum]NRN69820.1 hypothetical protein [Kibdelosporangium persicum]
MGARWRLAAVTALFALATACGSDSAGDKVASLGDGKGGDAQNSADSADGKTDEDRMREFAKCMREQGIDMPDPGPGGTMTAQRVEGEAEMEKMNKAGEVCNKLLPNGGKPKPLSPEELDKQRAQAKCMREHGINMPDPDPNNPGTAIDLGDGDQEKLEKAFKECGGEGRVAAGVAGGGR